MKKFASTLMMILSFVLIVTACSSGNSGNTPTNKPTDGAAATDAPASEAPVEDSFPKSSIDSSISGEVTFWTFLDNAAFDGELTAAFNAKYPNVKVKTIFVPFEDLHNNLQTTLAAGSGAPDVALVEFGQFPRYTSGGVLTDLLQAPFDAGKYKDQVSDYNWARWSSLDGKQLLGMPWDITPGVTFYRADIFEELGLPNDPAELGEYIQDPENYFTLAQTLKANGKLSGEWRDWPAHWLGDSYGYYDENMNWVRNTDEFVKFLDISKRVNQLALTPHDGYMSDAGKQRVQAGEQVMIFDGSFGARTLEANFPEQAGKWKVTSLPFGLNVGKGGSTFVIPAQSKNKEAAFAFSEFITTAPEAWELWFTQSVQPDWKHITSTDSYIGHSNAYLGDQEDFKLFEELAGQIPVRRLTRIDGLAWPLWVEGVLNAMDNNIDSKTALQQTEENIANQLKPDIDKLKAELGLQ